MNENHGVRRLNFLDKNRAKRQRRYTLMIDYILDVMEVVRSSADECQRKIRFPCFVPAGSIFCPWDTPQKIGNGTFIVETYWHLLVLRGTPNLDSRFFAECPSLVILFRETCALKRLTGTLRKISGIRKFGQKILSKMRERIANFKIPILAP